jgi:hypothetical protein
MRDLELGDMIAFKGDHLGLYGPPATLVVWAEKRQLLPIFQGEELNGFQSFRADTIKASDY